MAMHITGGLEQDEAKFARIDNEIDALRRLAAANPDDAIAQASIAGQINSLEWASRFGGHG